MEKPKEEKDRRKEEERLYDNQKVCQLLRISKRTLQRYRNNGALKFHSIYHKTYYKESDLHEFIRNNFDENEIKRQARKDKILDVHRSGILPTAVKQEVPFGLNNRLHPVGRTG